jgi:hypothetical protein
LERLGFCQGIRRWLRSYLNGRRQRVVIGESYSDRIPVLNGGHLRRIHNDMPAVVNHIIKLFTDDSKLICVIKNNSDLELVHKDLDVLVCWAKKWRMLKGILA